MSDEFDDVDEFLNILEDDEILNLIPDEINFNNNLNENVKLGNLNNFMPDYFNYKFKEVELKSELLLILIANKYKSYARDKVTRHDNLTIEIFGILKYIKENELENDIKCRHIRRLYNELKNKGFDYENNTIDHVVSCKLFLNVSNWVSESNHHIRIYSNSFKTLNSLRNLKIISKSTNNNKSVVESNIYRKIKK